MKKRFIPFLLISTLFASCYSEPNDDFKENDTNKTGQTSVSEDTNSANEDTKPTSEDTGSEPGDNTEGSEDPKPGDDTGGNEDPKPGDDTGGNEDPKPVKYQVTFVFGNGQSDLVVDYEPGATIEYPAVPTRSGYTFEGWDSDITVMPEKNITITAKWKTVKTESTVTYNFNGGIYDYSGIKTTYSVTGKIGDPIPSLPGNTNNYKKEHHKFVGWEPKLTVFPEENTTCFAQWQEDPKYLVTFVFNNGTADQSDYYYVGDTINYPANPTRSDYTFDGWDNDITVMPEQNITITAKWRPNATFKLTFNFNGNGQEDSEQYLTYGTSFSKPTPNPRNNYTFVGWDSAATTMPNDNLTINAIWKYNLAPGAYKRDTLESENPSPDVSYEAMCGNHFAISSSGELTRTSTGNLPNTSSSRQYIIVFPETVRSLGGNGVFQAMYNIVGVDLRATQITSIPQGTFHGNYTNGVQSGMSSYSGRNQNNLNEAYLPNTVTSVSNDIISGTNPVLKLYFDNTDKELITTLSASKQTGATFYYLEKSGNFKTV